MRPLIVDDGNDSLLHEWAILGGLSLVVSRSAARIYQGAKHCGLSNEQDLWLRLNGYERIFESCYLPSRVKGQSRKCLVHDLFAEVGGETCLTNISLSINLGCYDVLFYEAQSRMRDKITSVLDFGCGPGTILGSSMQKLAAVLIGFDFVDENIVAARKRGLKVMDTEELMITPSGSFDLLLSTYVLHYEALSDEDVDMATHVLRIGGIWAANFHKSRGVDWFAAMLEKNGGFDAVHEVAPSTYGDLIYARRSE